jgi:hypothetical protein
MPEEERAELLVGPACTVADGEAQDALREDGNQKRADENTSGDCDEVRPMPVTRRRRHLVGDQHGKKNGEAVELHRQDRVYRRLQLETRQERTCHQDDEQAPGETEQRRVEHVPRRHRSPRRGDAGGQCRNGVPQRRRHVRYHADADR